MKLLKRIGNFICWALMFSNFSAYAIDCLGESGNSVIYQKVQLSGGEVCLVGSGNGVDVVALYSNGGPLLRNSVLVSKSDVADGSVHIEAAEGVVKIYFEYPNNVYSIDFDVKDFSIKESLVVSTLRGSNGEVPSKLILRSKPGVIARARFELVDKNELFGRGDLILAKEVETSVSYSKSRIYREPNLKKGSEIYLAEGDVVRVLSYRDGWLKVLYKMPSGKAVKGWLTISSVI